MFKGKRVFISGGAGVIGRELVARLLQAGAELMVGDLKPRPQDWPRTIRYWQGDLNEVSAAELRQFAPNVVFNLAATFERSEESYEFWSENDRHNTRLSHHLMDILRDAPELERVVFASSYLIYNPELYQFDQPAKVPARLRETDPIYPRNLCGMAKLAHEIELRFLSEMAPSRFGAVAARIYRVYGKNSRDIISRWIQALLRDEPIHVFRQEGMFDYIYAGDVAEGLYRLALSGEQGIVNLGAGHARRVSEVVDVLRRHFPNIQAIHEESDIPYEASEANMDKFQSWTGWRPNRQIEDVIPELIAHYQQISQSSHQEAPTRPTGVLISSVSKKVPLIRSVETAIRKYGQQMETIGADSDESCIGQHFVDRFWHMPRLDQLSVEELAAYCEDNHIRVIIPTRDGELPWYAEHRDKLEAQGISVLISSPEAVQLCVDKLAFYQFGKQEGFPVIPAATELAQLDAPAYVVKERFGAKAHNMALNVSRAVAEQHAVTLAQPIFQPYVEGTEISADLYVDRNGYCKGVVLRKREVVIDGESQVTSSFRDESLEQLCANFAERLGLRGHAIMQILIDDQGGYHIIECNARLGGASRLSLAMGLDSLYWFLLESGGADLDEYPFCRSAQEKRMVRFAEDMIQ